MDFLIYSSQIMKANNFVKSCLIDIFNFFLFQNFKIEVKDKENLQIKLGWKWIPHVVKNNLVEQLYFFSFNPIKSIN